MIHPWDHSWICLCVEICLVWGKKHNLWMCNFPQRREMFLAKMGGEEGGMGREQGRQHLGLEALSKNRRSCPLRHKMISSGNGPKRMTSSEIPQCQKAKHINTMWKLLFYITPPRGNLCSTGKPFSSSYGFWYICYFFFKSLLNLLQYCFHVLVFWPRGMWDLSSLTRDRTWIGRQSFNYWTTRDVPLIHLS